MKKQKGVFLLLLVGLLLLSALSAGGPTGVKAEQVAEKATTKTTKALPTTINMGGVFPIVKRPDAGRDRRDAFLLAVYEINNQTGPDRILPEGVTIVPLVKDDDNTAAGGTAAAQALIAEGADIVIGSSGSSVSAAMATELTPHKIVQISYASSSPALSDRELYPYFMRVAASDADQGVALFDLVKAFNWTKGATINTDDSYGTGLIEVFTEAFEDDGGTILTAQLFAPDATDVSAQVQAIKDADPEFVLGNFIDTDAATAFKKARDLDVLTMPWIITDGSSTTATFAGDAAVKEAMQLFIGTTPAPLTGAGYAAFNETWFDPANDFLEGPKFSQDTGTAFNSYAPLAYDAVFVAAKGLAEAESVEGDTLLPVLYDITHSGASGDIAFNDLGEVIGRYDYVQLVDETYHTFGEWQDDPALIAGDVLVLPGDTVWRLKATTAECILGCEAIVTATPGFSGLELIFALGLSVVILEAVRRKRRR